MFFQLEKLFVNVDQWIAITHWCPIQLIFHSVVRFLLTRQGIGSDYRSSIKSCVTVTNNLLDIVQEKPWIPGMLTNHSFNSVPSELTILDSFFTFFLKCVSNKNYYYSLAEERGRWRHVQFKENLFVNHYFLFLPNTERMRKIKL